MADINTRRKHDVVLKSNIGVTVDIDGAETNFKLLIGTLNETLMSMYGCYIVYDKADHGGVTELSNGLTTFNGFSILVSGEEAILQDRDQQAEDDYWDNHPEEAKRPPIDENLEKVILGAFKKVFPERFSSEENRYTIKHVTDEVENVGYVVWDSLTEKEVSPRFPFYEGAENFLKEIRDGKTTLSD